MLESAGRLPAKCPQCGGTAQADEANWVGAEQSICDYCGDSRSIDE
jgi:hypothetical protein